MIAVRVTPRSARPGIGDWADDADGRAFLTLRVAAAPADGAANAEVVKLIAKALGVSRSEVTIIAGTTARMKRVAIPFDEVEARRRLAS